MKVKLNQDACIGCGVCASTAEDLFEIGSEDGLSSAKCDVVPEGKEEEAKAAIESCPTGAIVEEN